MSKIFIIPKSSCICLLSQKHRSWIGAQPPGGILTCQGILFCASHLYTAESHFWAYLDSHLPCFPGSMSTVMTAQLAPPLISWLGTLFWEIASRVRRKDFSLPSSSCWLSLKPWSPCDTCDNTREVGIPLGGCLRTGRGLGGSVNLEIPAPLCSRCATEKGSWTNFQSVCVCR